jgi:hypothetical protein
MSQAQDAQERRIYMDVVYAGIAWIKFQCQSDIEPPFGRRLYLLDIGLRQYDE